MICVSFFISFLRFYSEARSGLGESGKKLTMTKGERRGEDGNRIKKKEYAMHVGKRRHQHGRTKNTR